MATTTPTNKTYTWQGTTRDDLLLIDTALRQGRTVILRKQGGRIRITGIKPLSDADGPELSPRASA